MIRENAELSTLRFYDIETDDAYHPYVAICTIVWETRTTIWIKGLHGDLTRKLLRELLSFLIEKNVHTIKTHRAISKNLPFVSYRDGEYAEILVADLVRAFIKKK